MWSSPNQVNTRTPYSKYKNITEIFFFLKYFQRSFFFHEIPWELFKKKNKEVFWQRLSKMLYFFIVKNISLQWDRIPYIWGNVHLGGIDIVYFQKKHFALWIWIPRLQTFSLCTSRSYSNINRKSQCTNSNSVSLDFNDPKIALTCLKVR